VQLTHVLLTVTYPEGQGEQIVPFYPNPEGQLLTHWLFNKKNPVEHAEQIA